VRGWAGLQSLDECDTIIISRVDALGSVAGVQRMPEPRRSAPTAGARCFVVIPYQ